MNTFHPYRQYMSQAPLVQAKIDRARTKTTKAKDDTADAEYDETLGRIVNHSGSSPFPILRLKMNTFHPHHRFMSDATILQARIDRAREAAEKDGKKDGDEGREPNLSASSISNRGSTTSVASTASTKVGPACTVTCGLVPVSCSG
ncbi:hypothetical protein ACHHYP_02259 [Achlya hypogyna]|uniref:Uncharacterized protein n=1 Tax=Achlya hypogyna TaxID=1202772 RepID=A0A1V9Z7D4_ACHHY|nr:hypothetical protein ACHHYP_02259 [Achlya hypogyna]